MSLNCPEHLKYAASHEWLETHDGYVAVGITDHAQSLLGDIVFLELPKIGAHVKAAQACAVVESVKAASDIYSPIAGEVIEINQSVVSSPEALNQDAYQNWLFKIKPADGADLSSLLDAASYAKSIGA
jgi:glycine cleavage system H protein